MKCKWSGFFSDWFRWKPGQTAESVRFVVHFGIIGKTTHTHTHRKWSAHAEKLFPHTQYKRLIAGVSFKDKCARQKQSYSLLIDRPTRNPRRQMINADLISSLFCRWKIVIQWWETKFIFKNEHANKRCNQFAIQPNFTSALQLIFPVQAKWIIQRNKNDDYRPNWTCTPRVLLNGDHKIN